VEWCNWALVLVPVLMGLDDDAAVAEGGGELSGVDGWLSVKLDRCKKYLLGEPLLLSGGVRSAAIVVVGRTGRG
jgi:hypothetical protein